MDWLWLSLYYAFAMLWQTFWALVIGFAISAALQVFVSKRQMSHAFGQTNLKSVSLATALGAASSSCSYAAVAAARSAIQQGAALIPALAFMFASTNLVVELGAMLWVLMGWQFVLAEVLGALVLIGMMWILVRTFVSDHLEGEMRKFAQSAVESEACSHHTGHGDAPSIRAAGSKLQRLASAFVMDWRMLWKEIAVGFVISGFVAALVPTEWWKALFIEQGPAPLRLIENAIVGPLIAIPSFVCSCANIPLASLLWANGISFGGVISFIYADLIVVPLILIYVKYYGARAATKIVLIFYVSIVTAGIVIDLIFSQAGLIPRQPRTEHAMSHFEITWNYTTWLDLVALIAAGVLLFIHLRNRIAGRHSPAVHQAHH